MKSPQNAKGKKKKKREREKIYNSHELKEDNTKDWASLVVQWLRLHTSIAGGTGTNPGQGTKIPHASWYGQKNPKTKSNIIIAYPYVAHLYA